MATDIPLGWIGFKWLLAATGGYRWLLVTIYDWSCYSCIHVAVGSNCRLLASHMDGYGLSDYWQL